MNERSEGKNLGMVNGNWNEPKPILRLGGLTITCSALTRVTLADAHERYSSILVSTRDYRRHRQTMESYIIVLLNI